MQDYLENLESARNLESLSEVPRLSESGAAYLSELDIPSEMWGSVSPEQIEARVELIQSRMEELGVSDPELLRESGALSPEMMDELNLRLEAPTDNVQIEQVSEVLRDCEGLRYKNWQKLELSERVSLLNDLEQKIARIEHRPPCPISTARLREGHWGGFNPNTRSIVINEDYVRRSGGNEYLFKEVLDTLVHEGRHAYQDYNVNVHRTHSRASEVNSWAENMEGGKWGYWGDTRTRLGQRLYEQQAIEIDARNFAADVLESFEGKGQKGMTEGRSKLEGQGPESAQVSFEGMPEGTRMRYESATDRLDTAKSELLADLKSYGISPLGSIGTDRIWGGFDYQSTLNVRDAINKARDNDRITDRTYKDMMEKLVKASHYNV